jgi:hypothetical protein
MVKMRYFRGTGMIFPRLAFLGFLKFVYFFYGRDRPRPSNFFTGIFGRCPFPDLHCWAFSAGTQIVVAKNLENTI